MMKYVSIFLILTSFSFAQASDSLSTATLQKRIDDGESAKAMMKSGVPMDKMYGLKYQGGYIFYFFPNDTSGMVIGPKDLAYEYDKNKTQIAWNCRGKKTGATEKAIGSGMRNTQKIHDAQCKLYDVEEKLWMLPAAEICLMYRGAGYKDWFLPAKNELHEAYMKLSYTGKIKFGNKDFWTSTETSADFAAVEFFKDGGRKHEFFGQSNFNKFYFYWVRPVRVFKK